MDLTVIAIPAYFGGMAAEYRWLKARAAERGATPGDYELRDTIASLSMGSASLLAPMVADRILKPITPGRGRYGKAVVAVAIGGAVIATAADVLARRAGGGLPEAGTVPDEPANPSLTAVAGSAEPGSAEPGSREQRRERARWLRKVASSSATAAVVSGGLAVATSVMAQTTSKKLWPKRKADLGTGPAAVLGAILAWDFIYYWNHRFAHESRYLWAMHVVHHSSERYNLSTALRQPVADAVTLNIPYGLLSLLGFNSDVIMTARGVNLLHQFWIHTEAIQSIGPLEKVINAPSHHRVHHGSNREYLDRNHGSILIIWDRLFGTYEPEGASVVYGLTRNIDTFNLGRIATHEWSDMLRDVARSDNWRDRLGYVLRGPGWAYQRREGSLDPMDDPETDGVGADDSVSQRRTELASQVG